MAQFRGLVQGNRGEASRLCGKNGVLITRANGWHFGVSVRLYYDEQTGKDTAAIELTSGSGFEGKSKVIGKFTRK